MIKNCGKSIMIGLAGLVAGVGGTLATQKCTNGTEDNTKQEIVMTKQETRAQENNPDTCYWETVKSTVTNPVKSQKQTKNAEQTQKDNVQEKNANDSSIIDNAVDFTKEHPIGTGAAAGGAIALGVAGAYASQRKKVQQKTKVSEEPAVELNPMTPAERIKKDQQPLIDNALDVIKYTEEIIPHFTKHLNAAKQALANGEHTCYYLNDGNLEQINILLVDDLLTLRQNSDTVTFDNKTNEIKEAHRSQDGRSEVISYNDDGTVTPCYSYRSVGSLNHDGYNYDSYWNKSYPKNAVTINPETHKAVSVGTTFYDENENVIEDTIVTSSKSEKKAHTKYYDAQTGQVTKEIKRETLYDCDDIAKVTSIDRTTGKQTDNIYESKDAQEEIDNNIHTITDFKTGKQYTVDMNEVEGLYKLAWRAREFATPLVENFEEDIKNHPENYEIEKKKAIIENDLDAKWEGTIIEIKDKKGNTKTLYPHCECIGYSISDDAGNSFKYEPFGSRRKSSLNIDGHDITCIAYNPTPDVPNAWKYALSNFSYSSVIDGKHVPTKNFGILLTSDMDPRLNEE